jgi:hypothetical protein
MPKRSSISDNNEELAKRLTEAATDAEPLSDDVRSLLAAALGRRGGLKGGKARAEKLSAERRQEIARLAAQKRWSKPQDE